MVQEAVRIFVPSDSSACSVGADAVAAEIRRVADDRGVDLQITRNGSRGLYWLEPLVEVLVAVVVQLSPQTDSQERCHPIGELSRAALDWCQSPAVRGYHCA